MKIIDISRKQSISFLAKSPPRGEDEADVGVGDGALIGVVDVFEVSGVRVGVAEEEDFRYGVFGDDFSMSMSPDSTYLQRCVSIVDGDIPRSAAISSMDFPPRNISKEICWDGIFGVSAAFESRLGREVAEATSD